MDYSDTYSKMSDDELLNVASTFDTVVPEGQSAIAAELCRRKLAPEDIKEYQRYLATIKPGDLPGKKKYLSESINGFGTGIYGKRDFHPDGSFLTTKWIIFFWLPIIPLKSMRLLRSSPRRASGSFGVGWSTEYEVLTETHPNSKQALFVYGFLLGVFLSVATTDYVPWPVGLVISGFVCIFPWLLRRVARKNMLNAGS
jgi:hypothetical protein